MIESIEIKNFKSIKSKYFPLRHLNILLGLNGMGKSSFIQNLLVFRQSKNIANGELSLNGEYTKIGTTKDALYKYQRNLLFQHILNFPIVMKLISLLIIQLMRIYSELLKFKKDFFEDIVS